MARVKNSFGLFAVLVMCGCIGGCQGKPMGRVEGVVTLDGKPLDGALVYSVPDRGLGAKATTDANGRFSLRETGARSDGLSVGLHRIAVSKVDEAAIMAEDATPKQLLPANYANHLTSGLSVEVVSGETKPFDIEIRSR